MSRHASTLTISRSELYDLVWSQPLATVAAKIGLTANGLAKLCDRLDIPRPTRSYWSKEPAVRGARTPLPGAPEDSTANITIGGDAQIARRKRTRLSPAERQDQLLDIAAAIAIGNGVQQVTLKRVAREAGISEAQAHNCFQGRIDLLLSLTRRELALLETKRRSRVARGHDRMARIVISTVSYLHEALERGPLLQMLLRNSEVRAALRSERSAATAVAREPILQVLSERFAMKREVANGSAAALSAVSLRAGGLLASGRTELSIAERLCLAIVMAGARSNETWRES
jgi:AcrR family transcriptional regulator